MSAVLPLLPIPRNSSDRRVDLQEFADRLPAHDWRMLSTILSKRDFSFDLVGNLPIELIIEIFSYLGPAAPFCYQNVSKQWLDKLSSFQVLDSSLSQWFDMPLSRENLEPKDAMALRYRRLEQMQRFRTARPSCQVTQAIPDLDACKQATIHGDWLGTVYYSDKCDDAMRVVNLRTGERFSLLGDAREKLVNLAVTDKLAVCTSSQSRLYAVDLATKKRKSLKLPSARWRSFAAQGNTASLLFRFAAGNDVFVWDFSTAKVSTFKPELDYTYRNSKGEEESVDMVPESVRMSSTTDTITVMFRGTSFDMAHLAFAKYSYSGKLLTSSEPAYFRPGKKLDPSPINLYANYFWKCNSTGVADRFYVCSNVAWNRESPSAYAFFEVNDSDLKIVSKEVTDHFQEFVQWKDVRLRGTFLNDVVEHSGAQVADGADEVEGPIVPVLEGDADAEYDESPFRASVCCNDKWVVAHGDDHIHIWGFEVDAKLEGLSDISDTDSFTPVHA